MSFAQWRQKANLGDSEAQYWVAIAYLEGKHDITERIRIRGEGQDAKTGEKLNITVVRDRKMMLANFWGPERIMTEPVIINKRLGLLYLISSFKNGYRNAKKVFKKITNDPEVQFILAEMYIKGHILSYNPKKGIRWLRKAADQNHVNAMQLLAQYFRKRESNRQLHHRLTKEGFFKKHSSLRAESFRQACLNDPNSRKQYHEFVSSRVFKIM
jgi:TPR repeat protein